MSAVDVTRQNMVASNCSQCRAAVLWTTTTNGARVALNASPIRVAMVMQSSDGVVVVRSGYSLHSETCTKKPATRRTRG